MTLEANAAGDYPRIARGAFVHPTATVIGNVLVGSRAFIGPHAVLRADEPGPEGTVAPIRIEAESNVQDLVVIHALGGTGVTIGPRTSIAHAALIHGPCTIGAGCFVGFKSVVFRAVLGNGVIVLHQALVEGVEILPGRCVPSMTAVCDPESAARLLPASPELCGFAEKVCQTNIGLAEAMMTPARRRRLQAASPRL